MSGSSSAAAPLLEKNELIYLLYRTKFGADLAASTRVPYWVPAVVTSVSSQMAGLLVLGGLNAPISVFKEDFCAHVDIYLSNLKHVTKLRPADLRERNEVLFCKFASYFPSASSVCPEGKDFWDKFTKKLRFGRDKVVKNVVPPTVIDVWKDACWHVERGWCLSDNYKLLFNHVDELFRKANVTKTEVVEVLPSFTLDRHVLRGLKLFYQSKRFVDVVDLSGPSLPKKNGLVSTVLKYLSTGSVPMPENWVSMPEKCVYYVSDNDGSVKSPCFQFPKEPFPARIIRGGDAILSPHELPVAISVREFRAMLCQRKVGCELWAQLLDDHLCLTRAVYAWSWMIPPSHLEPLCTSGVTVKVPITGSCCKCRCAVDGMASVRLACGAVCHVNCLRKHFHEHRFGMIGPRKVSCACELGCGIAAAMVLPRQECACCCCPLYAGVLASQLVPDGVNIAEAQLYHRVAINFIPRVMPFMNENRAVLYFTSEGLVVDLVERDSRVPNSALWSEMKPMIKRVFDVCFGSKKGTNQLLEASNKFLSLNIIKLGPCYMRTENFHVRQTESRGRGVFCSVAELPSGSTVGQYSNPVSDYIDGSKSKSSLLIVGGFDCLWEALVDRYSEYVMQLVPADDSLFEGLWSRFYRDRANRKRFQGDKAEVKAKFFSPLFSLYVNELILSNTFGIDVPDRYPLEESPFEGLFWKYAMDNFKDVVLCLGAVVIPMDFHEGKVRLPCKTLCAFVNRPNSGEAENACFSLNKEYLSIVVKLKRQVWKDQEILADYGPHFGGKSSLAEIADTLVARTNEEKRALFNYLHVIRDLFPSKLKDVDFLFSRLELSEEEIVAPMETGGLKNSLILYYTEGQWWPCLVTAVNNNMTTTDVKVNLRCLRTDLEVSVLKEYGRVWKDILLKQDITTYMEEAEHTLQGAVRNFGADLEGSYCLLNSAMVSDPSEVPIPARLSCDQTERLKKFFSGKSLNKFFATKKESWSKLTVEQQRRACYYALKQRGWDFFSRAGVVGVELEESFNLQFFDRHTVTSHLPYVYNHIVDGKAHCMKIVKVADGPNGIIVVSAEPFLVMGKNTEKKTFPFPSFDAYMKDFYRRWDGKEIAFESDEQGVKRVLEYALSYRAPTTTPPRSSSLDEVSDEAVVAMALSDLSNSSSESEQSEQSERIEEVPQTVSARKKRKKGTKLFTLCKRPREGRDKNIQYKYF